MTCDMGQGNVSSWGSPMDLHLQSPRGDDWQTEQSSSEEMLTMNPLFADEHGKASSGAGQKNSCVKPRNEQRDLPRLFQDATFIL